MTKLSAAMMATILLLSTAVSGETITKENNRRSSSASNKNPLERPLADVLKESPLYLAISEHLEKNQNPIGTMTSASSLKCDVYFKPDGTVGKVGAVAKKVLANPKFGILKTPLAHSDITGSCPNFEKMNEEQRTGFWIWVMAGIEYDETICGTRDLTIKNAYSGSTVVGRLHAPGQKGMQQLFGDSCKDVDTDGGQLTCSYSHLLRELNRSEDAKLFSHRAYFAIQRPRHAVHNRFKSFVSAYPVCGN